MPASIYVGVDLGTTFTGVAYACPPSKKIYTICQWPGSDTNESKVPTRLFYDHEKLLGWGFAKPASKDTGSKDVRQGFSVVERFKLAIDPSLDVLSDSTPEQSITSSGASRWYKDFLCRLYEHVSVLLRVIHPREWSQEVEFSFSVPNLYGPHIIAKFRDLIIDAGFGGGRHHVSIVSLTESQAAIVYASHSLASFKNNDLVLVCDAGGGTTDCSLLRIVHKEGGRLQMEEVSPAFGMRIGSTDIDYAIRNSYLSWLREGAWFEPILWPDPNVDCEIEKYKISFTTNTHAHLALHMTGHPELQIDSLDIRRIFDTSVAGIFQGINTEMKLLSSTGMLEADNMYVVLCGGLGSSQYVRATMTELLSYSRDSAIPHACVIDIQDPQLVVAKGLVAERMWAMADTRETWMEDGGGSPNASADPDSTTNKLADLPSQKRSKATVIKDESSIRSNLYRPQYDLLDDGTGNKRAGLDADFFYRQRLSPAIRSPPPPAFGSPPPPAFRSPPPPAIRRPPPPASRSASFPKVDLISRASFNQQQEILLRKQALYPVPPDPPTPSIIRGHLADGLPVAPKVKLDDQVYKGNQPRRGVIHPAGPSEIQGKLAQKIKSRHPQKSIFCKRCCRDLWRFPLNNKLYVENIIEWVIKQGEEIDDEWTARFLCQKMLSNTEGDHKKYIFQTHLVTSTEKAHQLPKSMTQGGAVVLCNIEADLSAFPLSEFEKHVHKLGLFKKSRIFYLVKYHVTASSSPADIIFEVLFRGKSAEHRVEQRVLWHDLSQAAPATLTPDIGSLPLRAH